MLDQAFSSQERKSITSKDEIYQLFLGRFFPLESEYGSRYPIESGSTRLLTFPARKCLLKSDDILIPFLCESELYAQILQMCMLKTVRSNASYSVFLEKVQKLVSILVKSI